MNSCSYINTEVASTDVTTDVTEFGMIPNEAYSTTTGAVIDNDYEYDYVI